MLRYVCLITESFLWWWWWNYSIIKKSKEQESKMEQVSKKKHTRCTVIQCTKYSTNMFRPINCSLSPLKWNRSCFPQNWPETKMNRRFFKTETEPKFKNQFRTFLIFNEKWCKLLVTQFPRMVKTTYNVTKYDSRLQSTSQHPTAISVGPSIMK